MPTKGVCLLVVDGYADWEPAHAMAELRRHGGYRVETVGLTSTPVTSMGGIIVLPSEAVADVDPADVADLVKALDAQDVPIAAICAATVAIGGIGLLRGRRHTSNGPGYMNKYVPGYADADAYVDAPAVRDRKLITASGLADVEFARELFEELEVLPAAARDQWAQIFRSGTLPQKTT